MILVLRKIKKTSPVILFMSVLLLAGVGYSIYKAAASFSVEVDSPAYDRTPSDVIVSPELETVIPQDDPVAIRSDREGFRLPDRALFDINRGTLRIGQSLQQGKLDGGTLAAAGYSGNNATIVAQQIQDFYDNIRIPGSEVVTKITINNESSYVNFAQSVIDSEFIPPDAGEIATASVYIGWIPQRGRWVPVSFSKRLL